MQCPHELEIKFPIWMGLEPWHSGLFKFILMTSVANWQDFGLTNLSARVQIPSNLEI